MKLSYLFGRRIRELTGKRRGYVLRAMVRGDRLVFLTCADGESEQEFTVAVKSANKFCDVIEYREEELCYCDSHALRSAMELYDYDGSFLGWIDDFTLKGDTVVCANFGKQKIPYGDLIVGDVAFLKHEQGYIERQFRELAKA